MMIHLTPSQSHLLVTNLGFNPSLAVDGELIVLMYPVSPDFQICQVYQMLPV
jgi:hypothetical protein